MSNTLATYSPEDVSVLIAGFVDIRGFVEGTFINISRDTPLFVTSESSDGQVSRTKRVSKTFTVKITLMGSSASNDLLTKMALADHNTHIVKFPLIIKDTLGSTLFFSTSTWIENTPDVSFSTEVTNREWVLKCSQATINVGGNEDASDLTEDLVNTIMGLAPGVRRIF